MRLPAEQRVPLAVAKSRDLACLAEESKSHYRRLLNAAHIAMHIWPDNEMTAQGAGAAASRILTGLKRDGLVEWRVSYRGSDVESWGYRITSAGLAEAKRSE